MASVTAEQREKIVLASHHHKRAPSIKTLDWKDLL